MLRVMSGNRILFYGLVHFSFGIHLGLGRWAQLLDYRSSKVTTTQQARKVRARVEDVHHATGERMMA